MYEEKEKIDCPYCGAKQSLIIQRWFWDRESMDDWGIYNWEEKCMECGHKDSHYEFDLEVQDYDGSIRKQIGENHPI